MVAELVEAFGYSGTLQKLFLDAQVFIILIMLIHSSGLSTWLQSPLHSRRGAQQRAWKASGQHTAK